MNAINNNIAVGSTINSVKMGGRAEDPVADGKVLATRKGMTEVHLVDFPSFAGGVMGLVVISSRSGPSCTTALPYRTSAEREEAKASLGF